MNLYRLYRESGIILFNSFKNGERYWIGYLAAQQGGGAMYDEIEIETFNAATKKETSVLSIYSSICPRNYSRIDEEEKENLYGLKEAMSIHNLNNKHAQNVIHSEIKI